MEIITWLISLLVFSFTILTLFNKLKHTSSKSKLPPGPPKLPLIGNLHQLAAKNSLPHQRLAELARVYGPIMHLRLGEVPTIVVSSADMAREVMRTHDVSFSSRPSIMLGEHIFYGCKDIALAPYGKYWRQVRKIATLELFTAKRIHSFQPIRLEEVTHLVRSIATEEGSVINLSKKLFGLSFDITSRLAFNNNKGTEQEKFRALVADISAISSGFSICDLYPSMEFLKSITGTRRKLQDLVRRCDSILDPIIHDHISKKKQGKGKVEHEDLVDVLLTFHNDVDDHNGSEFSLAMDNIKAIVLELFAAGSETSSTTLEWAMSELIKNPSVMQKAQYEVRRLLKLQDGEEMVDETRLDELKYLKQVIKETLRLHPPLPLLVPRESTEQCQIDNYDIPTKTRVIINAWSISRDPKYFPRPERFDPERFEDSSVDYKGAHFELIPFGAGRRMCPGMGLGLANVKLPLATLLYHFDWKLPNGIKSEDLNMDETFGIVGRRKNDLLVVPSVHSHSLFK